ncbi:MAG: DUF177 domain-containing protein [Ruminococcaceae bacterium]|nr:DUF177 domain-containing protein [Oscillospiraceae bacterium]
MKIDVSKIVKSDGATMDVSADIAIGSINFNGQEYVFLSPFKVKGIIKNSDGSLHLDAHVTARFSTLCARCLQEIERSFEFDMSEDYTSSPVEEDSLFLPIVSNTVDLAVAVEDNFCTSLPIRFLCSDDCKGLCHICGMNHNTGTCDCDTTEIDPRLAVLKDFLKND